jgi:hypothetical protein
MSTLSQPVRSRNLSNMVSGGRLLIVSYVRVQPRIRTRPIDRSDVSGAAMESMAMDIAES